jgi:hypothetical protein
LLFPQAYPVGHALVDGDHASFAFDDPSGILLMDSDLDAWLDLEPIQSVELAVVLAVDISHPARLSHLEFRQVRDRALRHVIVPDTTGALGYRKAVGTFSGMPEQCADTVDHMRRHKVFKAAGLGFKTLVPKP